MTDSTTDSRGSPSTATHDAPDVEVNRPTDNSPARSSLQTAWPALHRLDWVPVALATLVLLVTTVPKLPPSITFSDGGDLQLAATTLGIMHPPGYPGFVTLGYLATLVPGGDPTHMVSLACLASGLGALVLVMLFQVRLGVNAWLASALALALTADWRVWTNLVAPEIYTPSLFFCVASAYLLFKYARVGRRRVLLLAAFLFGFALANRPVVVWMLPFYLIGWWSAMARHALSMRRRFSLAGWATLCAAAPGLYSIGYIWVRDQPETAYNYIELKNEEFDFLPHATEGWRAKIQRLYWQVTAREFERYVRFSWRDVRNRLRWLNVQFFSQKWYMQYPRVTASIFTVILLLGAGLAYRRSPAAFWTLTGLAVGDFVFLSTYRIYGVAADLLPLMFAGVVLFGVAASSLLFTFGRRRHFAALLLIPVAAWTLYDARSRSTSSPTDALPFLSAVDMPTLPRDAMICSTWNESLPLWYDQLLISGRRDVKIVNTRPARWPMVIAAHGDRPRFTVMKSGGIPGYQLLPYRVTPGANGHERVYLWWAVPTEQ